MATSKLIAKNRCLEKFITPKNSWSPIDKALFTPKSFFNNYEKAQKLMLPAVKYSFKHHYENNVLYHRVCEVNGVTPEKIKSTNDFNKIPLLPDTFFKDYPEGKGFLNWLKTIFTGSIPNVDFKTDTSITMMMSLRSLIKKVLTLCLLVVLVVVLVSFLEILFLGIA